MATGWFIAPYNVNAQGVRECEVEQHFSQIIETDSGNYRYTEVLGDRGVVKVIASPATLTMLNGLPRWRRLPKDSLNDTISDLPLAQRRALRDAIVALGYSLSEVQSALGNNLENVTLRQVLQFVATRRIEAILNTVTGEITLSGQIRQCSPMPNEIDEQIQ